MYAFLSLVDVWGLAHWVKFAANEILKLFVKSKKKYVYLVVCWISIESDYGKLFYFIEQKDILYIISDIFYRI